MAQAHSISHKYFSNQDLCRPKLPCTSFPWLQLNPPFDLSIAWGGQNWMIAWDPLYLGGTAKMHLQNPTICLQTEDCAFAWTDPWHTPCSFVFWLGLDSLLNPSSGCLSMYLQMILYCPWILEWKTSHRNHVLWAHDRGTRVKSALLKGKDSVVSHVTCIP